MAGGSADIVFLIGAGFNRDAAGEAGKTEADLLPSFERPYQYPLVNDLLKVCFSREEFPLDRSIEDLFQESIESGNREPREILYEWLMELDYYIAPHLRRGGSHENNVYRKFLGKFQESPLLTFNYDSLPELLLLGEDSWSPVDGYGVEVQVHKPIIRRGSPPDEKSRRPILHLHGSLCVYPVTIGYEKRPGSNTLWMSDKPPEFMFDPDALGTLFFPFERVAPGLTYVQVHERVIAPVPNKADGLEGRFIEAVYRKAVDLIRSARQIVSIGYSFNGHDRHSYEQLLDAASGKPISVVAPNLEGTVERLSDEFPQIQWSHNNMSFAEWAASDFPGVL